jgi:multidrug efflux pump subunit AcrA (membrane-fusion protein)
VSVVLDTVDEQGTTDTAPIQAVVSEVGRAVGTDQRAFTVKIALPTSVATRTGSFARVVFRGAPRRALMVPPAAIQRQGQVSSVYVVHDGVARLRLVRLGPSSPEGVEVVAGLDAGESIVVSPLTRLADGARVTVQPVTTRPGGTS